MSDDRITTGEIYRICQRIETMVTAQNGRVRKLEMQVKVLWIAGLVVGGLFIAWIKKQVGL